MGGWIQSLMGAGIATGAPSYDRSLAVPIGGRTKGGTYASKDTARKVSAWYGAARILSDQFAMAPLKLYERTGNGGKKLLDKRPLAKLLSIKPNDLQNAFTLKHQLFGWRFWDGNCFAYKQRSEAGLLVGLVPIESNRVQPKISPTGELFYMVLRADGIWDKYSTDEIFHWIGPSDDGIIGMSLVSYAADQIGIATKRQEHQESLLDNRAMPTGMLSVPGKLNKDDFKELQAKIRKNFEGPVNSGKVMVLDNGTKFERAGMTNQDMQYIDDKRMDIGDVERFTGVPSLLLGDNSASTFNNMVEANRRLLMYGLNPHLVSFEAAVNDQLIDKGNRGALFFEFDRTDFERMDLEKQSNWVKNMIYSGVLSPNEGRAEFSYSPIDEPWADVPFRPENMAPADAPYQPKNPTPSNQAAADAQPQNDQNGGKNDKKVSKSSLKRSFSGLFQQIYGRMHTKTAGQFSRLSKNNAPSAVPGLMRDYLKEQIANYSQELSPAVIALAGAVSELSLTKEAEMDRLGLLLVDKFANHCLGWQPGAEVPVMDKFGDEAIEAVLEALGVDDGD